MNSISVAKEKQPAVSKASTTFNTDSNSNKRRRNQDGESKLKKRKSFKPGGSRGSRGIIYIGHIPHGFYEDEMKAYFNQFGTVTATAVARSKKTGRSRGYGFVEFEDQEVAKIAAETMNNYLMFNKIIKCKYIPPEERKKRVYSSDISMSNYPRKKNRFVTLKNNRQALSKLNQETYLKKVQKKINEFKNFFEEKGIDFNFTINDENSEPAEEPKQISNSSAVPKIENQIGVLEIDESDSEISFNTPPKVKKVIKKSSNHPATASKKEVLSKKIQAKKQLRSKKSSETQGKDKLNVKSEMDLNDREKRLERKLKAKVKSQPVKPKLSISSKMDINTKIKEKNFKLMKSSEVKETQKVAKNKHTLMGANEVTKASRKIKAKSKK